QILLGFQLSAVFQPGFARLGRYARWLDLVALALMILAFALLIAPAPFHRLVEGGRATAALHRFTTRMAEAALLPIGAAIGLDLFIIGEDRIGRTAAIFLGALLVLLAAVLWYGVEALRLRRAGDALMLEQDDGSERPDSTLDEKIGTLMTETRVV